MKYLPQKINAINEQHLKSIKLSYCTDKLNEEIYVFIINEEYRDRYFDLENFFERMKIIYINDKNRIIDDLRCELGNLSWKTKVDNNKLYISSNINLKIEKYHENVNNTP